MARTAALAVAIAGSLAALTLGLTQHRWAVGAALLGLALLQATGRIRPRPRRRRPKRYDS